MRASPSVKCGAFGLVCALLMGLGPRAAMADGVSAYLPLNLEPEMERQIERVLILADEPILKRPFAVALVEMALPQACETDQRLCTRVRNYLERYTHDYALTHASLTGAISRGADGFVPNEHGLPLKSDYELSAQGYIQPNDYVLASGGVITYKGRSVPTGSLLSFGFNWAQVDIGYRDHWWSPATESTMMIGTEAPTMPSVTLSNYEPLTRLGFQYEFFLARMSRSDHILSQGQGTSLQESGYPKLFGAQFSIEPFSGWSLGVNRQLQYGGAGLPDSAHVLFRNFFKPGGLSQTQGNQEASYISRFIFPSKTPFAVYFQYAGENTLDGGSELLGESALIAGIDFPRLWHYFDLTYEFSEWQNAWYTNNPFLDGMTNDGLVLGQWGADQRVFGDGVGARGQMLRLGWEPAFGGYLEERVRTVTNQNYGVYPYHRYLDFTLRYSRPWNGLTVGGEVLAGTDAFGKSFSRLSGFVRYGGNQQGRVDDSSDEAAVQNSIAGHGAELFVDAGVTAARVRADLQKGDPIVVSPVGVEPHLGLGARRAVTDKGDLGVRIEFDQVNGHSLIGVRAVDWRLRTGDHAAVSLFAGVDRYNVATPAYSLFAGAGAQWRDIVPKWDLNVDVRHGQNIARNHVLASDPPGVRPDSFYKIDSAVVYLSRRF